MEVDGSCLCNSVDQALSGCVTSAWAATDGAEGLAGDVAVGSATG
jgi:hypothetical protein